MRVLITTYCIIVAASTFGLFAQTNTGGAPASAPGSVPAPVSVSTPGSAPAAGSASAPGSYVLGAGDQVSVWVADSEELSSRPLRVDHAGTIRVPLVGQMEVAGLSTAQVEAELIAAAEPVHEETAGHGKCHGVTEPAGSVMGAVQRPRAQLRASKLMDCCQAGGEQMRAGTVTRGAGPIHGGQTTTGS